MLVVLGYLKIRKGQMLERKDIVDLIECLVFVQHRVDFVKKASVSSDSCEQIES